MRLRIRCAQRLQDPFEASLWILAAERTPLLPDDEKKIVELISLLDYLVPDELSPELVLRRLILLDVVNSLEEDKKPQLITFDEEDVVLDGIQDRKIYASVVQDPFKYGFESVRMIQALKSGSMMELPIAGNGSLFLPCEAITPENVAEFRRRLATRLKP